ncbi:P1 family peptidase [Actinoplanes sp. NPDC051861]|uniref:P1 family peptidase n=1 Tax=Actinoplanes sp. NPDC051861 TaxID=3155170 RepID=UPI003442EE36
MTEPQLLSAFAGHWTGEGTGVTVILPPPGTVGSGEVRGGAPATREFALLEPTRLVDRVDAVVLSGGSAFGLTAADGVMTLLRERGLGFPTPAGPVPIVVGMSIFDGSVATAPPGAGAGRDAAVAALRGDLFSRGTVGAGTGASTGKWRGHPAPGGVGWARGSAGAAQVAVVAVVNAWGDVLGETGRPLFAGPPVTRPHTPLGLENTTIAVVLTDARLTKSDCYLLAQSGHTGFARALHPAHSRFDGDAVVALATGEAGPDVDLDLLRAATTEITADAIRSAV